MNQEEINKLEEISEFYSNRNWGFYTKLVHFGFRTLKPFFNKGSFLEVGSADGEMTRFLLEVNQDISVVDAASKYVDAIKKLDPKIRAYHSLIEDFDNPQKYDNIVMAHILEHLVDPISVLKRVKGMLNEEGLLFIIVPNALSLHRQVGVKMGLIQNVTDLNEADKSVDHKRVYTPETLREDLIKAGFEIKEFGGIFLKPISNAQIEKQWSGELMEGYFQLGKDYPEIASELFAVCR